MDNQKIEELLSRRIEIFEDKPNIYPSKEEAKIRLSEGKKLRVYLGIDPTGPDLHLGHTIPLLFLKQILLLGHKPVLVIGDFTAMIGDPTGKDATRKPLTKEEVKGNMKNYLRQVNKILPEDSFVVEYNSKWSANMTLDKFFDLASNLTVQQLSARSMFRERMEKENPLGVHEFLYPLMQGYDSVAMEIDGEVGGSDQIFNMLIGRDLEKKLLNKDKLVFGTRLLVDEKSGKKMSKSEGGLISLSDSPWDMFSKVMQTVPDEMIVTVFELCTEKEMTWIDQNRTRSKTDPLELKKELAAELVKMYHSEKDAAASLRQWAKQVTNKEKPSEIEISPSPAPGSPLYEILVQLGLAKSNSEARRVIEQGGVKVNDVRITNPNEEIATESGAIIQVGKRKFRKFV